MELSDVCFRPFRPGDGASVVELLREVYGDDYYHLECYDADYLEASNRDGRRIVFVAESPIDGVVGVTGGAYYDCFPGSYELGLHLLKRSYRGRGLAKNLLKYCADKLTRMRVYGVYGMAITYQDKSQHECESIGIPATGFWLGRHRSDRSFFAVKPLCAKLHSVVVARCGMKRNSGPLYAPRVHRAFIADVYNSLQTPFSFAEKGVCLRDESSYFVIYDEDARNSDIYVSRIGRDLTQRISALTSGSDRHASYTVFLNMLDTGCASACDRLCDMGFYFTGVHPLHENLEFLMMHRECEGGYIWEEMKLTTTNKCMLDYILEHR